MGGETFPRNFLFLTYMSAPRINDNKNWSEKEMMHVILQPSSYAPASFRKTSKFFHYVEFQRFYFNIYLFTVHEFRVQKKGVGGRKVTPGYTMLFAHMNLPTHVRFFRCINFHSKHLQQVMEKNVDGFNGF